MFFKKKNWNFYLGNPLVSNEAKKGNYNFVLENYKYISAIDFRELFVLLISKKKKFYFSSKKSNFAIFIPVGLLAYLFKIKIKEIDKQVLKESHSFFIDCLQFINLKQKNLSIIGLNAGLLKQFIHNLQRIIPGLTVKGYLAYEKALVQKKQTYQFIQKANPDYLLVENRYPIEKNQKKGFFFPENSLILRWTRGLKIYSKRMSEVRKSYRKRWSLNLFFSCLSQWIKKSFSFLIHFLFLFFLIIGNSISLCVVLVFVFVGKWQVFK